MLYCLEDTAFEVLNKVDLGEHVYFTLALFSIEWLSSIDDVTEIIIVISSSSGILILTIDAISWILSPHQEIVGDFNLVVVNKQANKNRIKIFQ